MKFVIEKDEFVNKTFRIDRKLLEEMSQVCAEKGISLNRLLVLCVKYALKNLEE